MKFGFEREFFCQDQQGNFCLAGILPQDSCGYLAEVRGQEDYDPSKAMALYKWEEGKVFKRAEKQGITLIAQDYANIPTKLRKQWLRQYGKNASQEGSMYGRFINHSLATAGLHIHFSEQIEIEGKDGYKRVVNGMIDMPRWIYGLDRLFEKEIKQAKRVPGLYELKSHGFEYRSLPTSVDLDKVVECLLLLQGERWNSGMMSSVMT